MQTEKDQTLEVMDLKNFIEGKNIDFIDFGCSKGGSISFGQKRFGALHGLGIDIDQSKVIAAEAAGYDAINYDIHKIPDEKLVRFVTMSHFLEHVPILSDVKTFIRKACQVSNEFVYIQQPFFDADTYLFERNFKLFWSDWKGHPNRMTTLEMWLLLRDLKNEGLPITFSLHAYKPILNSLDPTIHPLSSPIDQFDYSSDIHPSKGHVVQFEENVFRELICLITLPDCDHEEQLKKLRFDRTLIDSAGNLKSNHHVLDIQGNSSEIRRELPS